MKDLSKRIWVSLFTVPSVFLIVFFCEFALFQYVVVLLFALISCVAIWEYSQFTKEKGCESSTKISFVLASMNVVAFFLSSQKPSLMWVPLCMYFLTILMFFILHLRKKEGAILDLAASCFGITYIVIPMAMILAILCSRTADFDGRLWVAYLLFVTKSSDVGAYFAGNLWGKTKLAPEISPGKTVEGGVFGLLCSIACSWVFYYISHKNPHLGFSLSLNASLIFGFLFGLIGPLGDLAESMLKRDANKKDSNTLPGFGGILDIIDSLLFTAPVLYLYLYTVKL